MAQEKVEKRLFAEIEVNVIFFPKERVLTASTPEGVYSDPDEWGGLVDLW